MRLGIKTTLFTFIFFLSACGGSDVASVSASGVATKKSFISVWQTTAPSETITLPLRSGYNYNFTVDWGDNSVSATVTAYNDSNITHTYAATGEHIVTISGTAEAWYFNNSGDKNKILRVSELGDLGWISFNNAFSGCANLTTVAGGVTTTVNDMSYMFYSAPNVIPDTSTWNTSSVNSMHSMFRDATNANPNTTNWNTSAVTSMTYMFFNATSAVPDTSNWDTSLVIDMSVMFDNATSANPNTANWNTTSVINMSFMFSGATNANPNTATWDTTNVKNMTQMFRDATSANPNTSTWNTAAVTNMSFMFMGASVANPNVASWNISAVTDLSFMFRNATSANPDISTWNFANVTTFASMFMGVTLPTVTYNNLLTRINATSAKNGVSLGGGNSKYTASSAADTARGVLVGRGWTITDGGPI